MITAILILILSLTFGVWLKWRKSLFSVFEGTGIPGPKPNLFCGNIWEMYRKNPIQCHGEWIKMYGKVVGYYFGPSPIVMTTDVDLIKKIFIKDFHKFSNRPSHMSLSVKERKDDVMFLRLSMLRDKKWKEMKSILSPAFTCNKLKMMTEVIKSSIKSLVDAVEQTSECDKTFDIYKLYKMYIIDVISKTSFGIQIDHNILRKVEAVFDTDFHSFFNVIGWSFPEVNTIWNLLDNMRLVVKGNGRNPFKEIIECLRPVIEFRRASHQNRRLDLLQLMIDSQILKSEEETISDENNTIENGKQKQQNVLKMTDNEVIGNSLGFFLAGYETTSASLAFITHFLIHNPEMQQRIRNEIRQVIQEEGKLDYYSVQRLKFMEQFVMESMRIYSPVYLFINREAKEDVQYGPYKIKKGMTIQIPIYHLGRDPDMWQDPEIFNPERFSKANEANLNSTVFSVFGVGPRICPAMRFALLTMQLALAEILNKYELIKTEDADDAKIDVRYKHIFLSPAKEVKLKVVLA